MVKRRSGDDTEHGGDAFSAADANANEAGDGADGVEADGISAEDGLVTAIETIATAAARLDAVNEEQDAVGGGDLAWTSLPAPVNPSIRDRSWYWCWSWCWSWWCWSCRCRWRLGTR